MITDPTGPAVPARGMAAINAHSNSVGVVPLSRPASKNRVAFGLTAGSTSTCPRRMRFRLSCSFFLSARMATAHDWPASTDDTLTRL